MAHGNRLQAKIAELVDHLRDGDQPLALADIAAVTEVLIGTMDIYFRSIDTRIYREFRELSTYIDNARKEIATLTPSDIKTSRLPRAGLELDAIVKATEEATNGIMEAAEAIMGTEADDVAGLKEAIEAHCMRIFEHCSFQDITGQRINKVVQTLEHIEARIDALKDIWGVDGAAREIVEDDSDLLRGPALEGEGIDQSAVDELMGGAEAEEKEKVKSSTAKKTAGKKAKTEKAEVAAEDSPATSSQESTQAEIDALFS